VKIDPLIHLWKFLFPADDMGLGKTLTMISLTLKSKQKDLRGIQGKNCFLDTP